MANVRGCNLPDDLYYLIEKHVWAKPVGDGVVRVGITAIAAKLSGGKLAAITVKAKNIGQEVLQGKSLATVESSKFVGPVPAPVTGVLLRANEKLVTDPNIAVSDPYGEGWVAEMQASNWDGEKGTLATGTDGIAKYQAKLEAENISCS
ncbi:MAG: glycine cleavage system protein H [Chloroflexi bacterium]|nr:glycine cleavage system protein H [Chloroflexota bacterium]